MGSLLRVKIAKWRGLRSPHAQCRKRRLLFWLPWTTRCVLLCFVVCCSVLQGVAVFCRVLQCLRRRLLFWFPRTTRCVLQCVAVFCSILQCIAVSEEKAFFLAPPDHQLCVAVFCSVLQCVAVFCSVLQCLRRRLSFWLPRTTSCVLQCFVVCYSVLQCFVVYCSV